MKRAGSGWRGRAFAAVLLCAATAVALPAQTFTTLYSFVATDGLYPYAGLVRGIDGSFYGTTQGGGTSAYCSFGPTSGCGTVFKVTPSGALTMLYSFCPESGCTDGEEPVGTLIQAGNGSLYGTTLYGGANGFGTIFKITPSGTLTTLYNFCAQSNCADGELPFGGLVEGADGSFYGTTESGGASGAGTVFKITPGGTFTTLHNFDFTDGFDPAAALIQATDGNFYGTTSGGSGSGGCALGTYSCGTVFKMTQAGTLTTLYNFCSQSGCADGAQPYSPLVQGADGNFYGTTTEVLTNGGGTVFKITPTGTLTTLYTFCSRPACQDGQYPFGGLVQGTDGNFYGTTYFGGASNSGTVFRIASSGVLARLHSFCSQWACGDGEAPYATLIQGTTGEFYGTAYSGGGSYAGTVFAISVGLGPFVETEPTGGQIGATVKILGSNLSGATSVTFNGTAAVFKVLSGSLISTTVPAGATSGAVTVTVSGKTLSSNLPFRVRP